VIVLDYTIEKRELQLMQQVYTTLMALTKKLDRQEIKNLGGLTVRQCIVILAIKHCEKDGASLSSIAKRLGTTKQNVDQMLAVLEKKGYVQRSVNDNDRRTVSIKVTESGEKAMLECVEKSSSFLMDVFDGMSDGEMETLLRLSHKLHSFDGDEYSEYVSDLVRILAGEYSDMVTSILEECRRRRRKSA